MKPDSDPLLERLSASEAPELARSLGILKAQLPDASQLAELAARLSAQGLPIQSSTTTPHLPRGRAGLKYSLIVGSALLGLGGAFLLLRQRHADPELPRVTVETVDSSAVSGPVPSPAKLAARTAHGASQPVAQPNTPGSSSSADLPNDASKPLVEPARAADPAAVNRGVTGPARGTDMVRAAPEPSAALKTPHSTSKPISPGGEPGVAARPSELELLRDARLSLRSSPAQALALTEQHRQLYPRGAMAQERELIAISALVSSGRRTAALSRAADFEHDFPNSPYRKQVTELVR